MPAFFQTTGTALIDELNKLDSIGPWDSSYNNYNSNQNKEEPEEDTFNDNEFGDFDSSKLPAFFSDKNHDEDDFPSLDQSLLSAMDAEATHTSKKKLYETFPISP